MKTILIAVLSLFYSSIAYSQEYENLVLEGGGIRGIAYTGAVKILEEKQVLSQIRRVGGTSVGAIVGALISVGYSANELQMIMFDLKIQTFNDGGGFFIGGQKRLRENFGWYKGEELEKWIGRLIKEKTGNEDCSFQQLHDLSLVNTKYKDLYVTATNLTKQRAETFCWQTNPGMKIRTAVRISTSVPLYFSAVLLDSAGNIVKKPLSSQSYQVYVDGGILANYPHAMFDSWEFIKPEKDGSASAINKKTLGLKLERPEQIEFTGEGYIAPYRIRSLKNYIGALYNIIIENLNRTQSLEDEQFRTIYISTNNISPKVKRITLEQKQLLYRNGMQAAERFFN